MVKSYQYIISDKLAGWVPYIQWHGTQRSAEKRNMWDMCKTEAWKEQFIAAAKWTDH